MDPKKLWQEQAKEPSQVTIYWTRRKARQLDRKNRRERFNSVLGHLVVIALCIGGIAISPGLWVLRTALAIAFVWAAAGAWISHRGEWARPMPGDGGLETGIEFYRHEILLQRLLYNRWLLWSLGPIILATAAFIAIPLTLMFRVVPESLLLSAPALFIALFVAARGFADTIKRRKRELGREIEELNAIERESRSI